MQTIKSGTFKPTSPMMAPRAFHTATLLANGDVLVVGGLNADAATAMAPQSVRVEALLPGGMSLDQQAYASSVERYDPNQQKWSSAAPLHGARWSHTALLLRSGLVMVTGGSDGTTLRSSELYDVPSNRWFASADLKIPRFAHTATLLPSGEVLVVGGNNLQPSGGEVLDSVERFDPATGQWADMPSLPVARMNHTATLLDTGELLVAGGYSATDNAALRSACIFDPQRRLWREIEPMPTPRMLQTATLLEDGSVLLAGGADAPFGLPLNSGVLYCPNDGTWQPTTALTVARSRHTATRLNSGEVLVAGSTGVFDIGDARSAEIYNPASNEWVPVGDLSDGRHSHSATLLKSGAVLIAGGQIPTPDPGYTGSAELFS
ncbi:hypothetical protein I5P86_07515 [Pseudomonas glycinae]|uniref:Kelch repeat-containing protein n=1 Tax=Pseudomonas glycinae TaxID=1785145 RepID=UPI0018D8C9C8|nr:kelch repeat-containing protein [Pseudomonas glycinae]MBH3404896.1 hypothetical protein [Pseudomonas glycinae]